MSYLVWIQLKVSLFIICSIRQTRERWACYIFAVTRLLHHLILSWQSPTMAEGRLFVLWVFELHSVILCCWLLCAQRSKQFNTCQLTAIVSHFHFNRMLFLGIFFSISADWAKWYIDTVCHRAKVADKKTQNTTSESCGEVVASCWLFLCFSCLQEVASIAFMPSMPTPFIPDWCWWTLYR